MDEAAVFFWILLFACLFAMLGHALGKDKGQGTACAALGFFFGPLGLLIGLSLPSTIEAEAQRQIEVQRRMERTLPSDMKSASPPHTAFPVMHVESRSDVPVGERAADLRAIDDELAAIHERIKVLQREREARVALERQAVRAHEEAEARAREAEVARREADELRKKLDAAEERERQRIQAEMEAKNPLPDAVIDEDVLAFVEWRNRAEKRRKA